MTMNRSSEELAMRHALTEWSRETFPGARVVHELVVRESRADMAFIQTDNLVLVEIKSDRDKLDRLQDQIDTFRAVSPLTILAFGPGWYKAALSPWRYRVPLLRVDPSADRPVEINRSAGRLVPDLSVTVPMLDLLWHSELTAIASRRGLLAGKSRVNVRPLIERIARALTGNEIVAEVCRELRARNAFPKVPASDPPIPIEKGPRDAVPMLRPLL